MQIKKYASNAERQKAYRERNQVNDIDRLYKWKLHNKNYKRDRTKEFANRRVNRKQKRMDIPFIAFDGEGCNTNIVQTHLRSQSDLDGMPVYKQHYTVLTASDGSYIENWKDGLSTEDCLDFFLHFAGEAYLVGYFFGYDVVKIMRDLTPVQLQGLWKVGNTPFGDYIISYVPNKILRIKRVSDNVSVVLYDVRGFFQKSFIKALEDWKIDVPEIIKDGKKSRKSFSAKDKKEIKKYNLLECKLLVELMNKMRTSMKVVDMVPNAWYGVGAMAQMVFTDKQIKQHIETPVAMVPEFLKAYYGGRNQVLKLGEFDKVYMHDINSAYPDAIRNLPSSIGKWYEAKPEFYDYPYCLYDVEWNLPSNTIITPFPVRCNSNIYYPLSGAGTYWQPEVEAAMKYYAKYIRIKHVWFFEPIDSDVRPFAFYEEYYKQRQQFILEGNDAQIVLKLALNAGYGKLAQSIGKRDKAPPFQNFFYAGVITSHTRAKVFELAMRDPKSVIAFATDGVASLKQLTEHSQVKELGAWEVKEVQDYFIIQTGIYTYKDADVEKFKSRGFGYKSVNYTEVRNEWRKNGIQGSYHYTENRFIGIGVGLQRNHPEIIGCWVDMPRKIVFYPMSMDFNEKKVNATNGHPRSIDLKPVKTVGKSESYKMKVNWLDSIDDQEKQDDLDQVP